MSYLGGEGEKPSPLLYSFPEMAASTITLYRPVGQKELDLIAATAFRQFPPRPPHQPIFYPLLTLEYAEQIARDWNTRDQASDSVGYVLEFEVDAAYISRFEPKQVGGLDMWNTGFRPSNYRNSTVMS